jgi:hypothetical protein
MARKPRDGKTPIKYSPVDVTPVSTSNEECERHLRAFIAQFIHIDRQRRWTHCLLESPTKAAQHLHRFATDRDARCCTELPGADSFPQSLGNVYGAKRGLYFDGIAPACKMTAAEAATMATEHFRDALVSFVPGKRVLFFHHDGTAWRCDRL